MKPGWDGKRHISYQQQKDLFYNYYAQPGPVQRRGRRDVRLPRGRCRRTSATPGSPTSRSCRTSIMYKHQRSYYTLQPRRRLATHQRPLRHRLASAAQNWWTEMHFPMSNNIWALHNDFYYPGVCGGKARQSLRHRSRV